MQGGVVEKYEGTGVTQAGPQARLCSPTLTQSQHAGSLNLGVLLCEMGATAPTPELHGAPAGWRDSPGTTLLGTWRQRSGIPAAAKPRASAIVFLT